ncbi:hypothetical protein LKM00_26365 [Bacillus wiedmannii]|uniref:hypothetical protein n=2 Tax=Bacillus wiedmannii TaxID=1890302 RepID=UPI001E4365C1|nr:hypothetical protein [Bacillus wiedmannii]MCC2380925.1 hypothetical protein [Bacillus wiedmannii]
MNQNHSDMIQILWYNVKKSIEDCNDQGYNIENIQFDSKLINIFPTVNRIDEQANRMGISIQHAVFVAEGYFQIPIEIDYEARQEYDIFETAADILVYLYCKITKIDKTLEQILQEI